MMYLDVQAAVVNSSMFILHEGFGILMPVCFISLPFFETLLFRYLFHRPRDLCYPDLAASIVLFGK